MKDGISAEAVKKLTEKYSQLYVNPASTKAVLGDPEIDALLRLAKKNKFRTEEVLADLKQLYPGHAAIQKLSELQLNRHLRSLKESSVSPRQGSPKQKVPKAGAPPKPAQDSPKQDAGSAPTPQGIPKAGKEAEQGALL